jgi:hypothetical protein
MLSLQKQTEESTAEENGAVLEELRGREFAMLLEITAEKRMRLAL